MFISEIKQNKIKKFIDTNIKKYMDINSNDLIEKSHLTTPWLNARKGLKIDEISNNKINFFDLEEYAKSSEYNLI